MVSMSDKVGVKVAGAISGVVYLPSLESTVFELRKEIENLLGASPDSLKLLLGGRNLQDNQKKLSAVGINANSKVLVIGRSTAASSEMATAEAKQRQLQKLKRVLDSMAKRDAQVRRTEGCSGHGSGGSGSFQGSPNRAASHG
ncbi:hypothetical protein DUNSADRAFT_12821, partial [Dunaliella salina]